VRLAHHEPEPFIQDESWRMGSTGAAHDWAQIKYATPEVRRKARSYLESLDEAGLNTKAPYAGTLNALVGKDVSVHYLLQRISVHTFFHVSDIASVRWRRLGQRVGEDPGALLSCL
jgi:hypothetical protein